MGTTESLVLGTVKPHLALVWEAVQAAHTRVRNNPDLNDLSMRGIATYENDLVVAELIKHFDEIPGFKLVEEKPKNLRFLLVKDRFLLWPKKVDSGRQKSNYPTVHAQEMVDGQYEFPSMESLPLVVLGFWVNPYEDYIRRLSFNPPFEAKPAWFFDVVLPETSQFPPKSGQVPPAQPGGKVRLRIIRGDKQDRLLS